MRYSTVHTFNRESDRKGVEEKEREGGVGVEGENSATTAELMVGRPLDPRRLSTWSFSTDSHACKDPAGKICEGFCRHGREQEEKN